MRSPYSDLLVLDLSQVLSGPFAAMLFADMGARVIKVEHPPHGDPTRRFGPFVNGESLFFQFVNRGKESIALDLKDERDRAVLRQLVARADVLIENLRPGAMERLGFGYEACRTLNPRLVYASISGFGLTGPMKDEAAYDLVVQGLSGLMSINGQPGDPPTKIGVSMVDIGSGMYLYGAIASALFARERTGKGALIDLALFDSMIPFLEYAALDVAATGKAPGRRGNTHPSISPFSVYRAKDGELIICAGDDALFATFCETIGMREAIGAEKFRSNVERSEFEPELHKLIDACLASDTVASWIARLKAAGVPCAPILNVDEAMHLPQVQARNMLVEVDGELLPGNPMKIEGFPDEHSHRRAPALDAGRAPIEREFGPWPAASLSHSAPGGR